MSEGSPESRRRSFPRGFDALEAVFGFLDEFFRDERVEEAHRHALRLAVEEMFTNLVKYNGSGPPEIEMGLARRGGRVEISLVDTDTDPFDPRLAPDARTDLPLEERRPGGLGIHLVRRMVDRIDYDYDGRKATTTLVKSLE